MTGRRKPHCTTHRPRENQSANSITAERYSRAKRGVVTASPADSQEAVYVVECNVPLGGRRLG